MLSTRSPAAQRWFDTGLNWCYGFNHEEAKAAQRGFDHVRLAREEAGGASEVEQRLIEALAARYQQPYAVTVAEFEHWDDAYAAEMRRVHYQFPHDHDVMALLVEALMMRTVRRLWDLKTGTPAPGPHGMPWLPCSSIRGMSPKRGETKELPQVRACSQPRGAVVEGSP